MHIHRVHINIEFHYRIDKMSHALPNVKNPTSAKSSNAKHVWFSGSCIDHFAKGPRYNNTIHAQPLISFSIVY